MLSWLEFTVGLLTWCGVLWDGFATVVLPRTVTPMRRTSGRFYRWSWFLWSGLMIVAFALIYHALGPRFQSAAGSVGFGTLLYMSASTFLTLGLGDVTSPDAVGRLFILLEAGSGYIFLALIITYMPVLEQ